MDALSIVDELFKKKPKPFLAPFVEAGVERVLTVQDGVPFWMRVRGQQPGWWWVEPLDRREAVLGEPALFHETAEYLRMLPRHLAVTLFHVNDLDYLAVPLNASDAAQRGWPDAAPRLAHLVRFGSFSPFEVIQVRDLAGTLFYERPAQVPQLRSRLISLRRRVLAGEDWRDLDLNSDLRRAAGLVEDHLQRSAEEAERRAEQEKMTTRERDIRHQLEFSGARLVSWRGGEVTYEYGGVSRTVSIDPNQRVLSAGICLGGTDSMHDLSSIVHVMEEARRLHRFDLPEEQWR